MKRIDEWKNARDVIKVLDERIHRIRHYGFTFLAGLLTADTWLLSNAKDQESHLGVALATVSLLFIVGLRLSEMQWGLLQRATATRAIVIEQALNFELSEVISDRYEEERWSRGPRIIYAILCLVGACIGGWKTTDAGRAILAVELIVAFGVILWDQELELDPSGGADWTIMPSVCVKGRPLRITVTNVASGALTFDEGTDQLLLVDAQIAGTAKGGIEEKDVAHVALPQLHTLRPLDQYQSFSWRIPTDDLKAGIYHVVIRKNGRSLRRKVEIRAK
jgi:hypothetical protein